MTVDLSNMLSRHIIWTEGKLEAFKECAAYVQFMGDALVKQPEMSIALQMKLPDVTVYSHFLTDAQCDELVSQAGTNLKRSSVVDKDTGGSVVNEARTSSGTFFRRGQTPLIKYVEQRISDLTGIPVEHGEGLQILRYEVGQQYKPHHDYFDSNNKGFANIVKDGGQRIGTFLIYLNTPIKGGGTVLPEAGVTVTANKGNALLFKYPKASADEKTLHGGEPVEAGVKWVATKWLRERKF
jgi:prolyl 4-hydroxylase